MLMETNKLVDESRPNPFPEYSFMIHNSAYYNTSPLPYWMHIKSLKATEIPYDHFVQKLEAEHSNLPGYITRVYRDNDSKELKSEFNPNLLSGVFGITR